MDDRHMGCASDIKDGRVTTWLALGWIVTLAGIPAGVESWIDAAWIAPLVSRTVG